MSSLGMAFGISPRYGGAFFPEYGPFRNCPPCRVAPLNLPMYPAGGGTRREDNVAVVHLYITSWFLAR